MARKAVADLFDYAAELGVEPSAEPGLFAFIARAIEEPPPAPWTVHCDDRGRIFYFDSCTGESSWEHPSEATYRFLVAAYRRVMEAVDRPAAVLNEIEALRRLGQAEIQNWVQVRSADGTPYFFELRTRVTRWDNPRNEIVSSLELPFRMLTSLSEDKHLQEHRALPLPPAGQTQEIESKGLLALPIPPDSQSQEDSCFLGHWEYGETSLGYRITERQGGELFFEETSADGIEVAGVLHRRQGWLEGDLRSVNGSQPNADHGTIRLRCDQGNLISNFRALGSSDWGEDIAANHIPVADDVVINVKTEEVALEESQVPFAFVDDSNQARRDVAVQKAEEAQLQVREEHLAASKADMQRLGEELATKEGAIEASLAALREETIAKEMELKRREDEIAVKEGELKSRAEDASAREEVLQLRAEEVELEKGIAEEVQPVPRGTSPPPPLPRGGKEYGEGDEEAQEVKALPPPEDGAHSASPRLEPPPDTTQPLQEEKGSLDLTLDLDYGRTDLAAFKSDLIEILLKSRADPSILDRIQIDFREGSIVAELRGPFDDMFALRPLLLQSAAAAEHGPAQVDQNPEQVDVNPSLHEDSSQPRTAPSEGAVLTSEHPSLQEEASRPRTAPSEGTVLASEHPSLQDEASRPRTAPSEGTVLASEHPSLQEEASRPRTAPNEGAVGNVEQWDAGLSLAASTTNQGLRRRADARWWWHAAPLKIEDKQAADLCYTAGIQAAHQLWDVRAAEIGVKPSLHWRVREAEEVRQKLSDVLSQLNEDSKPASPSGMSPRTPARRGLQKEKTMLPSAAAHRGRVERCEAELTMLVKQASSRNAHAPLKRAHSTGSIARASHDVGGFGFSPLLGAERTWKAFGSAPLADALANGPPTGTPVGGDPAVRTVPITDLVGWKPGASSKAFRDGNGKFSDAHWMPSIASQTGKKSKPGFSGTSRGRG